MSVYLRDWCSVSEVLLLHVLVIAGLVEAALIETVVIRAYQELVALALWEVHARDAYRDALSLDSALHFSSSPQIEVDNGLVELAETPLTDLAVVANTHYVVAVLCAGDGQTVDRLVVASVLLQATLCDWQLLGAHIPLQDVAACCRADDYGWLEGVEDGLGDLILRDEG